jgi:hypothetical protein
MGNFTRRQEDGGREYQPRNGMIGELAACPHESLPRFVPRNGIRELASVIVPSCECAVVWSLALLAVGGGASVIAAVRSHCSSCRRICQRLFVFCLVGLGATTMLALTLQNSAWIPCAVAYSLLSVAATVDFVPRHEVTARAF